MITKGIVEEIVSPYQVKVRIPTIDRVVTSRISTSKDDLNVATICSFPNCYINPQVGDVVFVGFEDNTYYKAVILGHLTREGMSDTYADVTFGNLSVKSSAELPTQTSIGEVSSNNIQQLSGCSENIQNQINHIKEQLDLIMKTLFPETGGN